jgi:hypothetical protein
MIRAFKIIAKLNRFENRNGFHHVYLLFLDALSSIRICISIWSPTTMQTSRDRLHLAGKQTTNKIIYSVKVDLSFQLFTRLDTFLLL